MRKMIGTACVAVAAFLATTVVASASSILLGSDYLHTDPGTQFGGVAFAGVPIGISTGNADTIERRLSDASSGIAIAVELQVLQLMSSVPADFGLGVDFYFMTLQSARGGPASTGSMTITITGPDDGLPGTPEGTFDSFFDVFFDIRRGALSGPIALSKSLRLTTQGVCWDATPTPEQLLVTGPVGNGLANSHTGKTGGDMDFFPCKHQRVFPTGDLIAYEPAAAAAAAVPEPASLFLLGTGGLGLIAKMRRRKKQNASNA